jgi:hypothetical protein
MTSQLLVDRAVVSGGLRGGSQTPELVSASPIRCHTAQFYPTFALIAPLLYGLGEHLVVRHRNMKSGTYRADSVGGVTGDPAAATIA